MDILSDKIVITRKKHNCSACGRAFNKGTKMRTQVNILDGIQTWRECPTCQVLLSKYRSHFEDDYDHITYELCVDEVLERGQTPEGLLSALAELSHELGNCNKPDNVKSVCPKCGSKDVQPYREHLCCYECGEYFKQTVL